MSTYPQPPRKFLSGEGSWLTDEDGHRYLDMLSGLAVTSLGHAHPVVAAATAKQARTLCHVSNLFDNQHREPLAATLHQLVMGADSTQQGQVFFTNSGAEANECAIKLARKFGGHGRFQVVSAFGSFHGRTLATLHATGQPTKHEAFQPLPEGFRHAAWNDIDSFCNAVDPTVAAILLEPVQGEGGVNPATKEFFGAIRTLCNERGILMMIDEVQTGLGRCGSWFAFQEFGIVPDVVTIAKALGNGMPIGACWARAEVAEVFEPGDHGTTYGGQPLAAGTARAVLEVMIAEDVPRRARERGAQLMGLLRTVEGISEVRGVGLLIAAELADAPAAAVNAALLEAGVVANAVTPTAIRFAPSLLITPEEVELAVHTLSEVLAAHTAAQSPDTHSSDTQSSETSMASPKDNPRI